jgi:hypothetical protein
MERYLSCADKAVGGGRVGEWIGRYDVIGEAKTMCGVEGILKCCRHVPWFWVSLYILGGIPSYVFTTYKL